MKLILRDISESVIEIEEPEIVIRDRKHPERCYVMQVSGGYAMASADYVKHNFEIEIKTHTETLEMVLVDDRIKKYP